MMAISMAEEDCYEQIPASSVHFLPRESAETDSSIKQIIPYLLVRTSTGHLGCYQRKGTEDRLHGLWSVGIGGHVSTVDQSDHAGELKTYVRNGLFREMTEEFESMPPGIPIFLGLINEEKTSVGAVHLGLVFCLEINSPETVIPGKELFRFCWITAAEIHGLKLEYWSNLAMQLAGHRAAHRSEYAEF